MDHQRKTIATLGQATRTALGDIPTNETVNTTVLVFARQCRELARMDPAYVAAIRDEAKSRVWEMWPDDEVVEKVMTAENDPDHTYWMIAVPDRLVRAWKGRVMQDQPGHIMAQLVTLARPPQPDQGGDND